MLIFLVLQLLYQVSLRLFFGLAVADSGTWTVEHIVIPSDPAAVRGGLGDNPHRCRSLFRASTATRRAR
jgi:hypothetical protein